MLRGQAELIQLLQYKVVPDSREVADALLEAADNAFTREEAAKAEGRTRVMISAALQQLACDCLWRVGDPLRAVTALLDDGRLQVRLNRQLTITPYHLSPLLS